MRDIARLGSRAAGARAAMVAYLAFVAVVFTLVSAIQVRPAAVVEQAGGVIDLRGFDFGSPFTAGPSGGIVAISGFTGNQQFYPEQLLTPADFATPGSAPSSGLNTFQRHQRAATDGSGMPRPFTPADTRSVQFGTLRFELKLPPGQTYALSGNTIEYSEATYINEQLVGLTGQPGTTAATTTPQVVHQTVFFTPATETVEVIRQWANFNHFEGGGATRLYLGSAAAIARMNQVNAITTWVSAGCLLTVALFCLGLFAVRAPGIRADATGSPIAPQRRAYYLWFAGCCALLAAQAVNSRHYFEMLLPALDWSVQMAGQYLVRLAVPAMFVAFVASLLPGLLPKWPRLVFYAWVGVCAVAVVVGEPIFFTRFVRPVTVTLTAFMLYVFAMLAIRARRARPEQLLVLAGAAVFALGWVGELAFFAVAARRYFGLLEGLSQPATLVWVWLNLAAVTLCFLRAEREAGAARAEARALAERNALLAEAARQRSALFARVSHELRTPLTVMSTYSQLAVRALRRGDYADPSLARLGYIPAEAARLAALTSAALTEFIDEPGGPEISPREILGEGDGGGFESLALRASLNHRDITAGLTRNLCTNPVMAEVDLINLARKVADQFEPTAQLRGNIISVEAPSSSFKVNADADQLAQVLLNLLANANAATAGGAIEIGAERQGDMVALTVTDTGTGIPAERIPPVLAGIHVSPGSNAQTDPSGRHAGLGLPISAEIAKAHGGQLTLASQPGKGTKATLALPTVSA